ncbi:MAG: hypothetical protein RL275_291 [Chloroflexota bacterium]|jgi:hypothetical protein
MKPFSNFPSFDIAFPELNEFIHELVQEYKTGNLNSWDELDKRTHRFYSLDMMDLIESKAPGWKNMSSYSEGITRTHVTCVFLGMYMLDEFQSLSPEQQQIAKWIILFHDIDKFHIRKVKDTMHAFNSAVVAANTLPSLGFFTTYKYNELIQSWSDYTRNASIPTDVKESPKPDNQKLPRILSEIDELFGQDTPASLIVKTILLHISPAVDKNYPTPSPLTEDEMQRFINPPLFPLLKVMMLSDNEGWSMFNPMVRDQQKRDALIAFERIQELIELAHK